MLRKLPLPALLGLAAYYALFGGEYTLLDLKGIHHRTAAAQDALEELRTETAGLRERVESLEGDPRVLETLARERFGMIREGEILYRFAEVDEVPDRP